LHAPSATFFGFNHSQTKQHTLPVKKENKQGQDITFLTKDEQ
jgi:hypothetical protein